MNNNIRMKTKGKFLTKQYFYSICSGHSGDEEDCSRCQKGMWRYVWAIWLSGLLYKISPKLWRIWANRPNSKTRKFLEETFPNLKQPNQ